MNDHMEREKIIVRTSVIGIITNVLLAGFKAAVGLLSNSIAVVLDAVNNLSDALSMRSMSTTVQARSIPLFVSTCATAPRRSCSTSRR